MAKSHSTRRKPAVRSSRHNQPRKTPRRRPAGGKLPDLQPFLNAFLDGLALVRAAHAAACRADQWGPIETTLRVGIEALERVYVDLDGAETSLHHFRGRRGSKS
jgi:hypothetical protein